MAISNIDVRMWSKLGMRGTFGTELLKAAEKDERIVAITADLGTTSGLDRFAEKIPERMINVGIAEQNLMGVAAGMARQGYKPFATTFANFACLRANEFMRHFMAYMQSEICVVGLGAGYAMEYFGNTHYGIEDVAAIRSMPNITILSPADGLELTKMINAIVRYENPVYLRLSGVMNCPIVYKEDFDYEIGKANWVSGCEEDASEVALIATGMMVKRSIEAADMLAEKGICASVIDMNTIKPLDESVLNSVKGKRLIVTVEEHSIIGGLGSAVTEYYRDMKESAALHCIGVKQGYIKAGSYEYMLSQMGLTSTAIADNIETLLMED